MLVIRDSQLKILAEDQFRRFEEVQAAHLRARFSSMEFTHHPDRLRAFVIEGIRRAATYGLVDLYDLRRFLEFRAEYGTDFDLLPWASKILNDRTLSGCGKMEQLDSYTLFTLRPDHGE